MQPVVESWKEPERTRARSMRIDRAIATPVQQVVLTDLTEMAREVHRIVE
jgi:hypothetical protein